ncbi:hypothetical protein [Sphingobium phenoxybenzoativorans]|uniref:hypothetical protein n=1 Tax=Sphingobium phenoxybenzoativorans TaxID=1592790 RepID=UPI0008730156|nr:hypothetical protein [Sphingobium phenoxybenzoativorans]
MYAAHYDAAQIAGPSTYSFSRKAEFLVEESIRRARDAENWPDLKKWYRIRLRMKRFAQSPGPMPIDIQHVAQAV